LEGASGAAAPGGTVRGAAKCAENEYFGKEKKNYFPLQTDVKLLNQIKETKSKFVISVKGGHCDYSPQAPRKLVVPLRGGLCRDVIRLLN
jgi:hypothetical protein